MNTDHLYAVIMAGGRGERFWPLGRSSQPKQLLPLAGDRTMIEETVLRLFPLFAPERILVVTNRSFVERLRELLPLPPENIVGEPEGRDTAPCVALAAALVYRLDSSPEATMVLLPADHVIQPAKELQNTLFLAAQHAAGGFLISIGITPSHPSTGYGYIHYREKIDDHFFKVLGFKEKPDRETASAFLADGHYKWNSGIFVWTVQTIRREFAEHCPALSDFIDRMIAAEDFNLALTEHFKNCPKISIDYAVMEKAGNIRMANAAFYWNDIGSWSSLRSLSVTDSAGNVLKGNVEAMDSRNCVVFSDDKTLIGLIGMNDTAVIKAGNGILVCPLSEEQRVRELVRRIAQNENGADFI